ncbi:sugar phosphate isomerase/epimerase, partial [Nostoc sp. NIES-2111]
MLGMNMLLWTAKVTPAHEALLRDLAAIGYGSVEIPLFDADPAQARELGRLLDLIGLARSGLAALGAEDNPISADPAVRDLARQNARTAVDAAGELGARMLVGPFHSGFGVHSGAGPTPDEWKRSVDFVGDLADYAAPRGVSLSLEFLNRFECYLL